MQNNSAYLTDEQLCVLARDGSRDAEEKLVIRFTKLVRALARPYFLIGGDTEDLLQEGLMGLIKSIRDYDPSRAVPFSKYAEMRIKSQLITAVRMSQRNKHKPLNNYVSIEPSSLDSDDDRSAYILSDSLQTEPEELIIGREKLRELIDSLEGKLSSFESNVLGLYLNGYSYAEISNRLEKPRKSVDNAVQRIKRKLSQQISKGVTSFD